MSTTLDEPFSNIEVIEALDENCFLTSPPAPLSCPPTPCAFTPLGNEILFNTECEDPTVVYPPGALDNLINDSCPHRHATVRAMNAVKTVLRKLVP